MMCAVSAGDGGEGGAVAFALVAFGVGAVSDGDEGGFEPFVACSVVGGGVEGGSGAAVGGG